MDAPDTPPPAPAVDPSSVPPDATAPGPAPAAPSAAAPPSFGARAARGLDLARRVIWAAIAFALAGAGAALVWVVVFGGKPTVPKKAALALEIKGQIVEQLSSRSPAQALGSIAGAGAAAKETLLRDLLDAIRLAKDDKRIVALVLELDDMGGAGITKLRDLREAILDFRKSGKKVFAVADSYSQAPYYLAAQADEVFLHPEGFVLISGLGRYRMYYKEAIDRLGLEWHVFRVGEYKSAVEPFLRDDASPEAKEADIEWMGDLWRAWLADVADGRKKKPEELTALVDEMPERLKAKKGDLAALALSERLVDRVAQRDEVKKRLTEVAGEDGKTKSWSRIDHDDYLAAVGGDRSGRGRGDAVAVIVAKGDIVDGRAAPGRIGGDSTAALVRKAREDGKVKAIVLRVDSGGGSAFASEVIRRELEVAQKAGKPVVVSMGSVAASGGYWIATSSDEIWASPSTITGSIGIFGMLPNYGKALAKHLGVHVDGVGTTWLAGAMRLDLPLDPRVAQMLQAAIDNGYEQFLARVAKARRMSRDDVNKIARGRVWSGEDAKGIGLVDKLGGLPQAIESAAAKAKLAKGYRVLWVEKERSFREKLFAGLFGRAAALLGAGADEPAPPPALEPLRALEAEARSLAAWNDPGGLYAHCLCEAR